MLAESVMREDYYHYRKRLNINLLSYVYKKLMFFQQKKYLVNIFRLINLDTTAKSNIGIVTLIRNEVKIIDSIIGKKGRILGLKINEVQIWNIYPISGTGHKKDRDIFFKETLCNYMMNWKDHTKYIVLLGIIIVLIERRIHCIILSSIYSIV